MPYKDPQQSKDYHHSYYLKNKEKQIFQVKQDRKLYPWKYTLVGIKQRCNNPNEVAYKYYGGKGIECLITEEELEFLWYRDKAWLLKQPSIDREDSNGHYELNNCRYIEKGKNSIERNIRCSVKRILQFDLDGKFIKEWKSITKASEVYNCHISNISNNLLLKNKTACGFIWRYKDE